jgi:hypothetical protein
VYVEKEKERAVQLIQSAAERKYGTPDIIPPQMRLRPPGVSQRVAELESFRSQGQQVAHVRAQQAAMALPYVASALQQLFGTSTGTQQQRQEEAESKKGGGNVFEKIGGALMKGGQKALQALDYPRQTLVMPLVAAGYEELGVSLEPGKEGQLARPVSPGEALAKGAKAIFTKGPKYIGEKIAEDIGIDKDKDVQQKVAAA